MAKSYRFDGAADLSQVLENGMPIYPGDAVPSFEPYSTLKKNGVNLTRLVLGSHTGTHVDAPIHFIEGGVSVDAMPPGAFIGEAVVVDVSSREPGTGIVPDDLRAQVEARAVPGDIVVLFTGCSRRWGDPSLNSNYTYLTGEAAEYLASRRVRAVGIDFLSVEKFGAKVPVAHRALLGHGVFIVESLGKGVEAFIDSRFLLICLPIKLAHGDGAPCRAIAVPIDQD
jgi:kynurenine formamidase